MSWVVLGLMNAVIATLLAGAVWGLRPWLSQPWRHTVWVLILLQLFATGPLLSGWSGPETTTPAGDLLFWMLCGLALVWSIGTCFVGWGHWKSYRQLIRLLPASSEGACPAAEQILRELAAITKVSRIPKFQLGNVPGPMLFGLPGRARILFPESLWKFLSESQRRTILAHELGHYARKDHWVRLLEVLAQTFYWWHPVAWWAAREIQEVEEECCDAWVIHQARCPRRVYAEAILDTLTACREFSADQIATGFWPQIWEAASVGPCPLLERRLVQIMKGSALPTPSLRLRAGLSAVALAGMPLILLNEISRESGLSPQTTFSASRLQVMTANKSWRDDLAQITKQVDKTLQYWGLSTLPVPFQPTVVNGPGDRYRLHVGLGGSLQVEDVKTGQLQHLNGLQITRVAFLPNGEQFLAGGVDGSVSLWNAATLASPQVLGQHRGEVLSLSADPLGERAVSGGADGQVFVWELATGQIVGRWKQAEGEVVSTRYSSDGSKLLVASRSSAANMTDLTVLESNRLALEFRLSGLPPGVMAAEFGGNRQVFFADHFGRMSVWDLPQPHAQPVALLMRAQVLNAALSPHAGLLESALQNQQEESELLTD